MNEIQKLKARLTELHEISKGIQAKADAEKRDLKADEQTELDKVFAEFEMVEADIKRRERIAAQEERLATPEGRQISPNPIAGTVPAVVNAAPAAGVDRNGLRNTRLTTVEERQRWGFQNMGEFCRSVRAAVVSPSNMDQRLIQNAAASTYGSEAAGADGGFAVPPEWRAEIMKMVDSEDSLLGRCDQQTAAGNSITYPIDETTAWQTTGGILTYWDTEAAALTQSKPSLKDLTLKLNRLTALVPVTDELLEDASAMSGYVTGKAGEKLAFKVNDAIVNGTGVGQPLGIMNAPCKVAVAKVTSQVAATFHAKNAVSMMSRMPAASFARSVWLINQDVLPQIMQLGFPVTDGTTTVAGAGALYMGPGQMANQGAYGSLLGRPIIVTEACATLGTEGDVILADLSKYLAVVKGNGVRADTSIHLWFDQNITAFRFVMRMNGQPWLSAAITRKNGSNTLSHFVTAAVRS
jgi:HK97 family phage major capsid protein